MRTDLDHLPAAKQRELERVVQILFEEFDEARALATQDWKKKGRILKIILYGSYARGGWVDEPHTAKGYQSDFDLLIIVNDKRLTDRVEYWAKAEERLNRELAITKTLKAPFTVHGFRSSFRDWVSEETNVQGEIAEAALAHTIPNKTEAAYRRGKLLKKRRGLMDEWALHCSLNGYQADRTTRNDASVVLAR
jgi:predicted nucleotidyltransferase